MDRLISAQQIGFIPPGSIHTKTGLTSEMINELSKKRYGGNIAIKVDISQAYDTLSWEYLWKVMENYKFSSTFISWAQLILSLAHISILVNGIPTDYFQPLWGLRQCDPLFPLLFALAKELLSRGITQLRKHNKVKHMVTYRDHHNPSHLLLTDGNMIFENENMRGLRHLAKFLHQYQMTSSQAMNKNKS